MFKFSRRWKLFVGLVLVILGGWAFGSRFGSSSNGASPDFSAARYQGAVVAQDIVNGSNQMASAIEAINKLDKEWRHAEALNMTVELIKQTQAQREKAIELSAQLEKMTGALSTIKDSDARQAALDSISNRLALIGRLLSYNDYLVQLLETLKTRFTGRTASIPVATIVDKINSEINAINNFNRQAGQAMDRFDEITKGKSE